MSSTYHTVVFLTYRYFLIKAWIRSLETYTRTTYYESGSMSLKRTARTYIRTVTGADHSKPLTTKIQYDESNADAVPCRHARSNHSRQPRHWSVKARPIHAASLSDLHFCLLRPTFPCYAENASETQWKSRLVSVIHR